ncbi:SpoIIE family protein phosphatase [bacterium]|nr:SpoIIE family protein phosphatase [bacterium]
MDRLDITSAPGRGTYVVCERWVRSGSGYEGDGPLTVGVATRPHPRETLNGDAFVVKHWRGQILVGLIDGLGHGVGAHRAGQAARQYVEAHFDRPLDELFRGVGRCCRGTRGVVMALARFDRDRSAVSFASIGNIEVRVLGSPEPVNFIVRRGILGGEAPKPVVTDHPWQPGWLFVLHSDGLTTRWQWEDVRDLADSPAPALATGLLRRLAKEDDDATVIVVRGAAP